MGGDILTSISTSLHILVFCGFRFLSTGKPHIFNRINVVYAKVKTVQDIVSFKLFFNMLRVFLFCQPVLKYGLKQCSSNFFH